MNLKRNCFSLISLIISVLAAYYWLQSWTLTTILVGSLVFHELGHALALRLSAGSRSSIIFIPMLGAATIPEKKLAQLSWYELAVVTLAGPIANLIIVSVALVVMICKHSLPSETELISLISLNVNLIAWNLLPFFIFDGGRFTMAIFSSLREKDDAALSGILSGIALIIGIILTAVGQFPYFLIVFYWGIRRQAHKDDPREAFSGRAMSYSQATELTLCYTLMLFGSLLATLLLPYWRSIG